MKTKNRYSCPECKTVVVLSYKPEKNFMGFQKISCPICENLFLYPLTLGYVIFYWMLVSINIISIIYTLFKGRTYDLIKSLANHPLGVVIIIYIVISLYRNQKLKRKIIEDMNINSTHI
ncbi:MAG: hypothetical protein HQK91_03220 [Nitrospirae bacterium]|nr:hypothetical protein [Nitrospirota bacterium]MBF0540447.1 hypothetical protein [Nitrospirota bacterium]